MVGRGPRCVHAPRTVERVTSRSGTASALAAYAFLVAMLGTTLPTPLYPLLAREFGFGELTTTLIFATYPLGVTAALLASGHWSDQVGRKPMLLAGLAFSALSAALFLVPGSLVWVFAGRLVSGFSAGIFTGTATAALVDLAPHEDRERAGLLAAAVNMGGLGLGPLLAGVLAAWVLAPLRTPFVVDLVLIAVAVVAVLRLPETVGRTDARELRPQLPTVPADVRPVFVRAAIAGFAGFAVLGLFGAVSPAFLGKVLGLTSPALEGVLVFSVFAASVVGQVLSLRLATERGMTVGCVALILGMVLLGASLPVSSLPLLVVGGLVAGVGQGLTFRAGLGSVTSAAAPERRGEIASAFFVALYVGIALPVVGEGVAATYLGLVTAGILFSVLVGALAALVLVLLLRMDRSNRV